MATKAALESDHRALVARWRALHKMVDGPTQWAMERLAQRFPVQATVPPFRAGMTGKRRTRRQQR